MPRYVECFKSATPKVLIEQFPRILYAKKNVRENMIIYCPTYRKYREFEDLPEKIKIFSPEVEKWCIVHNIKIVIRPHPIDRSKLQNISIPNYLILDDSKDIYETITKYKVLITDYSSLYYDAEKLGCKVLFVADDIDEYDKEEEGLFPDFKEYIKKNCFTNFIDVIKVIQLYHLPFLEGDTPKVDKSIFWEYIICSSDVSKSLPQILFLRFKFAIGFFFPGLSV